MSDKTETENKPPAHVAEKVIAVVPVVKIDQVEPAPRWVNVPAVVLRR